MWKTEEIIQGAKVNIIHYFIYFIYASFDITSHSGLFIPLQSAKFHFSLGFALPLIYFFYVDKTICKIHTSHVT